MSIKSKKVLPVLSKLEPFDGANYRCKSQKLLIFFEQLEVDYILTMELLDRSKPPVVTDATTTKDVAVVANTTTSKDATSDHVLAMGKNNFEKDNKIVCGHLLNHMMDSLFDMFVV